ncbi:outer membrane beta-barrel protein [Affinibrenneria salicis]|uniref:Outer membrane beta-barrel protein n=1 Tax=Affinibrenneria salicis TaxID=2590031 RepID=A0A5J5FQE9_9GAMM|nr:Ail/Lom family outer membrane beta-barrel protein [Affinibrenneria salicis]KAA8995244.1 outer membrane beta-barrel protein [Affinibrenneria salicis]
MKKLSVIAIAVAGLAFGSSAVAAGESTISIGYAQSDVDFDGFSPKDDPRGVNLKYRYEMDDNWGMIGSFTYTGSDSSYSAGNERASLDLTYYSLTVGPVYRFNEYISAYALVGVAHGKAEVEYENSSVRAWGEEKRTDLAGGVGLQFNVTPDFAIDASYEYTALDSVDVGTWALGLGYRF